MANRKQSASTVAATAALAKFFAENKEAFALAYAPENLAANIIQSAQYNGGWSEFAELLETVQGFSEMSLETASKHIYAGAYAKFKQVGTQAATEMNKEFLRESGNHPDKTRTQVYDTMHSSSKQHNIILRGEAGIKFAATATPDPRK